MQIEFWREHRIQDGHEHTSEVLAPSHPLVVAPAIVFIWSIELPTPSADEPVEYRDVAHMHLHDDLGLARVTSEGAFANE